MKKIVIPAILAATVLVAGFVAVMPMEKASTVHTFLASQISSVVAANRVISATMEIDGLGGPIDTIVLIDTTSIGEVAAGHFVVTLPNDEDDGICNAGDDPFSGLGIFVGVAGVELDDDVLAGTNTGISAGGTMDFDGDADTDEALCIFHAEFDPGDTDGGTITDVVIVNGSGIPLPENSAITVTVQLA